MPINTRFFKKWRKYGETAVNAAYLARGSAALAADELRMQIEYDPDGCNCDYTGEQAKYCHICKDVAHRRHDGQPVTARQAQHTCRCPHTFQILVQSLDKEYTASLGGICCLTDSDKHLDLCAAELAAEVLGQMRETPSTWMAL